MFSDEEREFVDDAVLDALTYAGEHYGDDAEIVAASIVLVIRDDKGVHVANQPAER